MALYIFQYLSNNIYIVESRATSREEIGNDMHFGTKHQLDIHNIPYDRHYAKQISDDDFLEFDFIICFDDYNLRTLKNRFGDNDKIIKLLSKDIDDPWYTGDFDKTYDDIYNGCVNLLKKIRD